MPLSFFRPLPRRLLLLVAIAALPAIVFAAGALYWLNAERRGTLESTMIQTARAIASAMEGEFGRAVSTVSALGVSAALDERDLPRFYRAAQRVLAGEPQWATISLAEPSGRYLFNLRRPLGAQLPSHLSELATFAAIRESGRPVIGGLFTGKVSGEPVFPVRVPVFRDGELRFVISAAVRPQAMLEVIAKQQAPAEGIVAIIDRNGSIVARSRRQEDFIGKPITADLRAAIERHGEGFASLMTLDGHRTYAAFRRSPESGWSVAIGLPSAVIDAPLRTSYFLLAAGGALSLALGVLGALLLSRRISRPIGELSAATAAIGRGEQPAIRPSTIPELQAMGAALLAAAHARREAEQVREQALGRERSARAQAEDMNRRKDEFLAMLGHELRNPLAVISNGVHILRRRPADPAIEEEALRMLDRQTEQLSHLMDDLLEAGRVTAGKVQLRLAPLDLGTEVEQMVATLRGSGRLAGHAVSVDTQAALVQGDRHRLQQVIANLLDNAAKYTPEGGRIEVRLRREGAQALLEVSDAGIGIEAPLLEKIFDLFVQGGRTLERSEGGLGLGLTLVRTLVELHGGSVSAHSDGPGRGSRFSVRLPALERASAPQPPAPGQPAAARTVLVVEDRDDARLSLRRLLELAGHRVLEAGDGPAGVRRALEDRPDFALIDVGLPVFDGYECARRIRSDPAGAAMRLVALTGYGSEADRSRAREAGFDLHLTKPVSPEALAAALSEPPIEPRDNP